MNWSAGKISTIYQKPAQANGLSTPPIGCVLHLPGLPGAGNKIYDRSPYGNIGTITGAVWKRLPSGLWVLDFDGTDDYVRITATDAIKAIRTFKMWIMMADTSGGLASHVLFIDSPGITQGLYAHQSGQFRVRFTNGVNSSWTYWQCPSTTTWYHLVGLLDSDDRAKLYVNAVRKATGDVLTGGFAAGVADLLLMGGSGGRYVEGYAALVEGHLGIWTKWDIQKSFDQEKHLFGVW